MKFANENHKKCEIYARLFGNYQNAIRVPVMGYGLWVMGYGLREYLGFQISSFKFLILGYGLWVTGYGTPLR